MQRKISPDAVLDPLREAVIKVRALVKKVEADILEAVDELEAEREQSQESRGELNDECFKLQGELDAIKFNEQAWERLATLIGDVRRGVREVDELYAYATEVGCLT